MAQVQFGKVPVLDFKLNCNSRAVEVSLWRDEALIEVLNGDTVELTHLRPNTVKTQVSERRLIEETVEVIGVSSGMGVIVLLGVDYEEYIVPDTMYSGDVEDLVEQHFEASF